MAKTLIIVESPTKAKIITRILGNNYEVVSSMGHLRDLPASKFGVDLNNNFEPDYQIIRGKKKIVNAIKNAAAKASKIYLAMDEDREGEAIGWHLLHALGIDPSDSSAERIVFHEITEDAIQDAVLHPRKLNMSLVDAQQARRIIDRIVGYKLSPLLSKKIRGGLSAGRVQSVGLKMIVEREKERLAFKVQIYFKVEGSVKKGSDEIDISVVGKSGKKFDKLELDVEEKASAIIDSIQNIKPVVSEIIGKEKKLKSPAPFITSTLQQEAFNRLNFNPARTMTVAQQLYEGIELADGNSSGLITYMRTDSFTIASSALKSVRKYISDTFGSEYLPEKANKYKSRKSAQEAHECIRPTDIIRDPESVKSILSTEQYKLYDLIWTRFLACQMESSRIKSNTIAFLCGDYDLKASGQTILFDGYTKIWKTKINEVLLPELQVGDELDWVKLSSSEHQTKPPARYTPATLVSEMEKRGIGRPSTYAAILKTLMYRKYIVLEKGSLIPQEIATIVVDVMEKHFKSIMDYEFTANMEENLDEVAEGQMPWKEMMAGFYGKFNKHYESALNNMEKIKDTSTDMKCPKCGSEMVIRWGRNGKFYACSAFPKCRQTFNMDEDGKVSVESESSYKCPKCSSDLLLKTGRFGKFFACSAYPKCKTTFAVGEDGAPMLPPIPKCPDCGEDTVIRMSRRGKFLACTGYPKCKFSMDLKEAQKKNA